MAKQYGMVIDLQKCVGCGACALACKTENNTQEAANGQTFNWADFIYKEAGKFPNVTYATLPVLCNHCTDAPCVKACPVKPKAMFKSPDGITLHNDERCIGCRRCQKACPYSVQDVKKQKSAYSVISFNDFNKPTHPAYHNSSEMIKGCTASGVETAKTADSLPPHRHQYQHPDYASVRKSGVTEKCIFCDHRLKKGEQPYCVAACPAKARIFGDLNDASSEPAKLLKQHKATRLKEEKKTRPNVAYIKSFSAKK